MPEAHFPVGFPPPLVVRLVQVKRMALAGTVGQSASEGAADCTVRDQSPLLLPDMPHATVAVVLPLAGVMSGSGDENVIVEGVTVGPVMEPKSVALTRNAEISVRRRAITGIPYGIEIVNVAVAE